MQTIKFKLQLFDDIVWIAFLHVGVECLFPSWTIWMSLQEGSGSKHEGGEHHRFFLIEIELCTIVANALVHFRLENWWFSTYFITHRIEISQ